MGREEDIFKKLNKQKPLVKRNGLQPLSQRDFDLSPVKAENNSEKVRGAQSYRFDDDESKTSLKKKELHAKPSSAEKIRQKLTGDKELSVSSEERKQLIVPESVKQEDTIQKKKQPSHEIFTDDKSGKRVERSYAPREELQYTPKKERVHAVKKVPKQKPIEQEEAEIVNLSDSVAASQKKLSYRHELKYYINYRDYIVLRNALKSMLSPDPYAGENNSYHIRSLYFDDIYDSALVEKIEGCDERKKYRIRIYNFSDDVIKFEKKSKAGQYVAKQSIGLNRDEYEMLLSGDFGFLKGRDEALAKEIYIEMRNNLLRPRVIVDYVREAYVTPVEDCRITFDKDLKGGLITGDIFDQNAPVMPLYESGLMVLEVKFNRFLPEYIKRALTNLNSADRCAISKYVISRKYE